jgi:chromosome segregation ATPase
MRAAGQIMQALDDDAERIDTLEKLLDDANDQLDEAEAIWDEKYDVIAESLKEEMAEQGRKGDPAEHTIITDTRRANREAYQNLRRAKRAVDRIQVQLRAKQSAVSSKQTLLKSAAAEGNGAYQPSPQRHVYGGQPR